MRKSHQSGFAASYITILVLLIVLAISLGISVVTVGQQKILRNIVLSQQAYYAAEAGIEDALLRITQGMNWSSPYTMTVGTGVATVTIPAPVGGTRTINSQGDVENRIREVQVVHELSTQGVSFFYGAQVGDGGLLMENISSVDGNVFSDGDIVAEEDTTITGTATVAGTGNKISGATIQTDAYGDICEDSTITGELHAASETGCSYGSFVMLSSPIDPIPLPIADSTITNWKNDAAAGTVISGNYTLSGTDQASLGPAKIEGNLLVENSAQLTMTGTIWVTGNMDIKNQGAVQLSGAYGSTSGVLIADGTVILQNDSQSRGSGESGSYFMYLSTSTANPAMAIKNETVAGIKVDILYAGQGWILIENDTQLREVIGYGIHLKNTAQLIYEVGLADASFSSGPGGSWQVTSWQEVE